MQHVRVARRLRRPADMPPDRPQHLSRSLPCGEGALVTGPLIRSLVALARLVAIEASLESGTLVVLDVYEDDAASVTAADSTTVENRLPR